MALSATFTANFSSFYDAVDKAEAKLKDFGAGADKVGGRLNAMANQFSGVKIIQDATLMAKAVEEIGGVTKLTEKELAKLGATANEAVAKMKALGMDVPKNLQQIADKTKVAQTATTDWMGTLTKIAGAIGIAFSVSAITNFIGSLFEAASAVKDLSLEWGVSTKAVQQWTSAAKGSGVEAATIGKSIQFLTEKLSESSEEYKALVRNLGLDPAALRKVSMEEAYRQIINAIKDVEDETLQLDLAIGVLGPSVKQQIGGIRDGMYEVADAQDYMGDVTIQRLADAEAQWKHYYDVAKIYSAEAVSAALGVLDKMTSSWGKFFSYLKAAAGASSPATIFIAKSALEDYQASLKKTGIQIEAVASHGTNLNKSLKTTAQVTEETRKKEEARKKGLAESAKALKDAEAAQDKYNQSLDDAVDTFKGRGLIDKAFLYVEALKQSIPVEKMTAAQQEIINKVMWAAIEVYEAAGEEIPKDLYAIWLATEKNHEAIGGFTRDLGNFEQATHIDLGQNLTLDPIPIENQLDALDQKIRAAFAALGAPLDKPVVKLESLQTSLGHLSGAFGKLGQVTGGAFGDVVGNIGNVIGGMNLASEATDTFKKGLESIDAGETQQGLVQAGTAAVSMAASFLQATQGVSALQAGIQGAMIGLAVGGPFAAFTAAAGFAIGVIRAHSTESAQQISYELKKMSQEIIAAAGGMELFASRAKAAGIDTASFFNAIRVGDAADFEAEVTRINAAFKYQDDAMKLLIATTEKYGFTLEELGPAMQRQELDKQAQQLYLDFQLLTKAGIDTVLVTEKMADSVNEYVHQALAMGVEVPSAMRPMLEAMAKSGTLLDENGEAITNLEDSGINFALTMSDGFKLMIKEVKNLTDAIGRSLNVAIKEIPQPKITGQVSWDVDPIPSAPTSHPQAEEVESYQTGTGGFKNFGKGTPVILHGWEAVVPREDSGAFATVSGAGGGATAAAMAPSIVINAQGAFFDTPDSLQRLANRVSDALTAKYSVMGKLRAAV